MQVRGLPVVVEILRRLIHLCLSDDIRLDCSRRISLVVAEMAWKRQKTLIPGQKQVNVLVLFS